MCGLIIHLQNADDTGQFVGDIDELRLYGRAVSEEEVRALYAEHKGIVLEQQIQGIKEELSGLVSRAEAVYAQGAADEDTSEAAALLAAIAKASEVLQGTDADALARGDADDAADLIEYLNAKVGSNPNGGTAWAEVRAANGHEAPYNVRYFEIGNEMNQGGADGTAAQTYWIDDVPGGALEGYVNGGTASFTRQYVVAQDDWNVSASYSDGSQNQEFWLRYARVEPDKKADDYDSFTAVDEGSVSVYVNGTKWTGMALPRSPKQCAAPWIRLMTITVRMAFRRRRSTFIPAMRPRIS